MLEDDSTASADDSLAARSEALPPREAWAGAVARSSARVVSGTVVDVRIGEDGQLAVLREDGDGRETPVLFPREPGCGGNHSPVIGRSMLLFIDDSDDEEPAQLSMGMAPFPASYLVDPHTDGSRVLMPWGYESVEVAGMMVEAAAHSEAL